MTEIIEYEPDAVVEATAGSIERSVDTVLNKEMGPSAAELAMQLTEKQWKWAEKYLKYHDKNRATEEVYDITSEGDNRIKSISKISHDLMRHEKVQAYIAARAREQTLPADTVLAQYARIAMASIEDFLNEDLLETTGQAMFDLRKAKRLGLMSCVRRIRQLDKGGMELELYSRMEALDRLAKHMGLLQEQEIKVDNYQITIVRE